MNGNILWQDADLWGIMIPKKKFIKDHAFVSEPFQNNNMSLHAHMHTVLLVVKWMVKLNKTMPKNKASTSMPDRNVLHIPTKYVLFKVVNLSLNLAGSDQRKYLEKIHSTISLKCSS